MLQFGYKASAEQFGPRDLLEFGVQAERSGFDSVFATDHLQPWRHRGEPCSGPTIALLAEPPHPPIGCGCW